MTALLNTLPGDIPGLLRKWSPVLVTIDSNQPSVRGVVLEPNIEPDEPDLRCLVWNERNGRDNKAAMFVRLDLNDATGRALAAAYAYHHRATQGFTGLSHDERAVMETALHFDRMSPEQIDLLARLVLRLAGRTP